MKKHPHAVGHLDRHIWPSLNVPVLFVPRWVMRVKQQHGHNKAAVALANKLARIAWAVAAHERDYDPRLTNA